MQRKRKRESDIDLNIQNQTARKFAGKQNRIKQQNVKTTLHKLVLKIAILFK